MPKGTSNGEILTPGSNRKPNSKKSNRIDPSKDELINPQEKSNNSVGEFDSGPKDTNQSRLNKSGLRPKSNRPDMEDLLSEMQDSLKDASLTNSTSQILPESSYQKLGQRPRLLQILDEWLAILTRTPLVSKKPIGSDKKKKQKPKQNQKRTKQEVTRRFSTRQVLILIIITILVLVIYFVARNGLKTAPRVIPTPTPVPTYSIPIPGEIELPGGWKLTVYPSESPFAEWKPTQPEWLKGTDLCKLIAIPWSKQVSAVFKTFTPGEAITLVMSNNDSFKYKIDKLSQVSMDNLLSLVDVTSPCMVIFVYQENSNTFDFLQASPSK